MRKGSVYLNDIPLTDARAHWQAALEKHGLYSALPGETVELTNACGRVTANPICARISAPHYHAAAMDGYAVRAVDTTTATETDPATLTVPKQAKYVDTGDAMPEWANAVIPIENVQSEGNPATSIQFYHASSPWQHVRAMGEDMVATELILPANHRLRPVDIGAIAAGGHAQVAVRICARVAVIPTGTELVPAGSNVKPGQIIEYNSLMLAAQVEQWGAHPTRCDIVPDRKADILAALRSAAETHDLILLNAGSSRGSEDYSADAIDELGTVLVHGIAVRPGHPVILGLLDPIPNSQRTAPIPIIGVPGYPVSAALTGEILVRPLLARWHGLADDTPLSMKATLARKVLSHTGDDEYMRVAVGKVGDNVVATPLSRGAGVITSLVRADGIVRIPRFSEGYPAGGKVNVDLYRHPDQIERSIVAIGSHDLTLDLLAQHLAAKGQGFRLVSANVGSLSGLIALRRGECHLAGCHLLDADTGEYNGSYVQQYLPDVPVSLITLVSREQGFIVARGNPKGITTIKDITQPDVLFINRQRGAGTRILLDYHLQESGLKPENVSGYEREEYTHLTVAAAVASGAADVGLGIRAATEALDLDFIPLASERYDLAIPEEHVDSQLLRPLLDLLHDPDFRHDVSALPGYSIEGMGCVR